VSCFVETVNTQRPKKKKGREDKFIPVRITVTVVVAEEVVLAGRLALLDLRAQSPLREKKKKKGNTHLQRLVDSRQEILSQVRHNVEQTSKVLLDALRGQASHKIERTVQLVGLRVLFYFWCMLFFGEQNKKRTGHTTR